MYVIYKIQYNFYTPLNTDINSKSNICLFKRLLQIHSTYNHIKDKNIV